MEMKVCVRFRIRRLEKNEELDQETEANSHCYRAMAWPLWLWLYPSLQLELRG